MNRAVLNAAMALRFDAADTKVKPEYRVDRGDVSRLRRHPSGALLIDGVAAREGVLVYHRDGREVRELVTPEAIRSGASSLSRAPVTLNHPPVGTLVTPENAKDLVVGDVDSSVRVGEGGMTEVSLAVRTDAAIASIEAFETTELSVGYILTKIDNTPGVHPVYGRYDLRQIEREANHLAVVDAARGGPSLSLRFDGKDIAVGYAPHAPHAPGRSRPGEVPRMNPLLAQLLASLGVTTQCADDDAAIRAVNTAVNARLDAAGAEKAKLEAASARADAEKTRADKAEARVAALEAAEKTRLDREQRSDLEALAVKLAIDPKAHADLPALRKAVAASVVGGQLRADASDAYIDALIDVARAGAARASDGEQRADGFSLDHWQAAKTSAAPPPAQNERADAKPRLGPAAISRNKIDAAAKAARGEA